MEATGLLDGIKENIEQKTGLLGDFVDDVDLRLQSLNYTLQEKDAILAYYNILNVAFKIKNECNITEIPQALYPLAVDMVCGSFLSNKLASGMLDGFDIDLNALFVTQIKEGDTSVSYSADKTSTPEERLNAVINYLTNHSLSQLVSYRKMKWT